MTDHHLDLAGLDILADQLPISVTLLDLEGRIVWYSRNAPRFVKRTPDIIGRNVADCHQPSSVATIDRILNEYRKGGRGEYAWKIEKEGVISTVRVGPFLQADRVMGLIHTVLIISPDDLPTSSSG